MLTAKAASVQSFSRMIEGAGWKGNKMMRGGNAVAELKLMRSQKRKKN